jgi:hypothetical protein
MKFDSRLFAWLLITVMGQDSVVGTATCCGLGHLGLKSQWKQDMLHLP